MWKKIAVWIITVMFFAAATPVFALDEGKKGPNPSKEAFEHASEKAKFKRSEDLKDKESARVAEKAQKEGEKAKREIEKQKKESEKAMKKRQKDLEKESRKMKKGFGKK